MDAETVASGAAEPRIEGLALMLAAVGELEAEAVTSKRGGRAPHADDVVKRLERAGVTLERDGVVRAMRVAADELRLITAVFTTAIDGTQDARSLHLTMAGVRWLRNQVRDPSAPDAPRPSRQPA